MKKIKYFVLIAAAAVAFTAWGAAAGDSPANKANPANANAYAVKPTTAAAAAPTVDALLALDTQANKAFINGDGKFFEGLLSDKLVMTSGGRRMSKADVVKMISGNKCDIKVGWALAEPQMVKINNDAYILSYKTSMEGTCTNDGKTEKQPSPVRAATVWVRYGAKWQAVYHGENPIIDPKNPPKVPSAAPATPADSKTAAQINSKPATHARPAVHTPDRITVALMSAENAIWEGWRAKDTKRIVDLTAKEIAFVNIFGDHFANKTDVIKDWTGALCDVKSFSLTDGVGTLVLPTVGILTLTGVANGTCGGADISGQKIYGTSVYVKEGNGWKWAFGFNSPS